MQSTDIPSTMSATRTECVDLSDYCRLCLQLPDECDLLDLQLIYDEDEHLSYHDCFTICTQIDLRAGHTLAPHQLCKSCGLELQVAYDFHKKVEESKKFLVQFEKSATALNVTDAAATTTPPIEEESAQHQPAETEVVDEALQEQHEDRYEIEEYETKHIIPEVLNSHDTSMEYEELEEQVDILDEYQSVNHFVEDTETVQVIIDEEDESRCEKIIPSADNEVDSIIENEYESTTNEDETSSKTNKPTIEEIQLSDNKQVRLITYQYEEIENDAESMQNTNKQINEQVQIPGDNSESVSVITKTGDLRRRKRYNGEHSCDCCNKVFKNRSRMLTHRLSHEVDRPKYECEECGRLYATKQAKSVHMNMTHNKTGDGLRCPICDKVFVVKKLLDIHVRYHTGDFPFVCDLCGRKFAQMCHLTTHKNVKHNSARYTCEHPGCGKFFTSSSSLRNHEFLHSEMPFECSYCKRGYPAKSKIKVHIRQKHGIEATSEEIEDMRKFHVMRSKLNLVKITEND